MAVRILMWNLRFFSESTIKEQNRGTKIVNWVQPAGAAPNYDIFIVIEPNKFSKPTNVGQSVQGASIKGLQILFYALHHRDNAWRAVPPRVLTCSNNKEIHGIFYYSTNVGFRGPETMAVPVPAALAGGLAPVLQQLGLAALPAVAPWGAVANSQVGRVRHSPDVNPATGVNEITFPNAGQRRAYMCRFRDAANNNEFDIYSHHAAPDSDHPANVNGILNFADIHEVGAGRARPVLITGDFNCCNMDDPCPNLPSSHHASEISAQWQLIGRGAERHLHRANTVEIISKASEVSGLAETVTTAAAGHAVALAGALTAPANAAIAAANTMAGALGPVPGATLAGLATAAATAVGQLATANAGNAAARANAVRDAVIAMALDVGANYRAPAYLRHWSVAVGQTRTAIDQAAGSAAQLAAVTQTGAAVASACVDLYPGLRPAEHATATTAAGQASGATAATPNLATLAKAARNALGTLVRSQYQSHILQSLSSLKTSNTARPTDYRNHAFDHIVTAGFAQTVNASVVDVISGDAGFAAAAAAPTNTFQAFYRRLYKGPGSGNHGISDHMPVQITVTP